MHADLFPKTEANLLLVLVSAKRQTHTEGIFSDVFDAFMKSSVPLVRNNTVIGEIGLVLGFRLSKVANKP
jgi:hypothetical protein